MNRCQISLKHVRYFVAALVVSFSGIFACFPHAALAAACTAPGTDYGTVTNTVSVPTTTTYRIWLRMAAPSASVNTVMLEIDGNTCYTVGGSDVPVYASGGSTYFTNDRTNWINHTSGSTVINQSLSSGSHTFKLIGLSDGVVVDRLILTADDTCTPTGTGDNCAMSYLAPDIDMNGVVNFLDFSAFASKYGQSGSSLGRVDINRDGVVNFLDFSLLANKYGQ